MDFTFTQDQELFRRTVRQFANDVLRPKYSHWDSAGQAPLEMRTRMGELGLTGLLLPEQYGGTPADFVTLGICCEELSRADISCSAVLCTNVLVGDLIARHGGEHLKERYLGPIARGEITIPIALAEPHCGSDAVALSTRAVRDGDHYVLTGEKTSITMASHVPAAIIYAKTDPSAGAHGISAFLVQTDAPGFSTSNFHDLGLRAYRRGSMHLDRVRVPAGDLIGGEGKGLQTVLSQFDFNRAIVALECIALAQQTIEETIEYVKTRTAFGQPVARYQGVAFPIVEAATKLEAARLLAYKVLWLRDHGLPHTKESAMVKSWVPRLAFETVHQMLLLYGHAGYSDDYPVGQRLRDVLGFSFGEGTAEIMKIVAAREIIGREFRPN